MRPPRAEIENAAPVRRVHDARRLRRQHGFGADMIQQPSLQKLALDNGTARFQDGFVGKEDLPLAHRADFAREAQPAQAIQKSGVEDAHRVQSGDVVLREAEALDIIHRPRQPAKDEVSAIRRQRAKEEAKRRLPDLPGLKISLRHSELVQVGEEGAGMGHGIGCVMGLRVYFVGIRVCAIMGFSGFPFLVIPAKAGIQKAAAQLGRPRARYVGALLSELGFAGFIGFSGFCRRLSVFVLPRFEVMAKNASILSESGISGL